MSVWDDMARDAGYQGDEARQVARMIEDGERDRACHEPQCSYAGHVWEDAGGGLQVCMGCGAERFTG